MLCRSSPAHSFGSAPTFVFFVLLHTVVLIRVRRYLFVYYTLETLLNHVFEDLRKPKAPNTVEEVIPEPKDDEGVVFKSFFRAGLRSPLYEMIGEVLKKFEIYLHQLTPNAIVILSVYIWALRSQGKCANAEGFCRVHEVHYQTKARDDGLHKNFGCYNFAYRKDTKAHVIGYRTKWPTGWTNEWFYVKADEKKREKLMSMVMSPLRLSFSMTRPLCHM
jgi:hypothetical protein